MDPMQAYGQTRKQRTLYVWLWVIAMAPNRLDIFMYVR